MNPVFASGFDGVIISRHKKLRSRLVPYLFNLPLRVHLTSPFVYGMIVPLVFLDIFVIIFQTICFRAWDVSMVRRADYVVLDRRHLAYLNGIEKLNCVFCGYATGVISFTREVAGRTEQYWCPIKHANKLRDQHHHFRNFINHADADGWQEKSKYPHFWH
jgi:hypothetical protein